jgi:hypothetical protein
MMLRASVETDKATRVIELGLEADGPAWDLYDVTATWRAKPRIFRPDHVRVVYTQDGTSWRLASISISGHLVLKGGRVSDNDQSRDSMTWQGENGYRANIGDAPEWVREIVAQAPLGITAYTWTDSERAEEVQSL